jgi:hypothetical protein
MATRSSPRGRGQSIRVLAGRASLAILFALALCATLVVPASAGDGVWTLVTSDAKGSYAVDPSNPNLLIAGSGDSLYRSANRGATWTKLLTYGDGFFYGATFDPGDPSVVYTILGPSGG